MYLLKIFACRRTSLAPHSKVFAISSNPLLRWKTCESNFETDEYKNPRPTNQPTHEEIRVENTKNGRKTWENSFETNEYQNPRQPTNQPTKRLASKIRKMLGKHVKTVLKPTNITAQGGPTNQPTHEEIDVENTKNARKTCENSIETDEYHSPWRTNQPTNPRRD